MKEGKRALLYTLMNVLYEMGYFIQSGKEVPGNTRLGEAEGRPGLSFTGFFKAHIR